MTNKNVFALADRDSGQIIMDGLSLDDAKARQSDFVRKPQIILNTLEPCDDDGWWDEIDRAILRSTVTY